MRKLEENIFKSCLKGKVKFTTSALVKFLITGTVALSLTACGGGGGGSSSSGGGTVSKPIVENTANSTVGLKTENEKFTNKGNVDLTGNKTEDSVIGIVGKNSDITNNAEIKIDDIKLANSKILLASETGKDVLDKLKEVGESFAIFAENGKVVNEKDGELIISGSDVHGIFGLYSEITNNGVIKTDGEKSENVTGISSLAGNVTNNNEITILSENAVGIRVHNNTNVAGIELEKNNGITVLNKGHITVKGESAEGIEGNGNNITIHNDADGIIEIENKIVTGNQDGVNTYGISIDEGTGNKVINDGIIKVTLISDSEVSDKWYNAYGISTEGNNTKIENDGTINLTVDFTKQEIDSSVAGIKSEGQNNNIDNGKEIVIKVSGAVISRNYIRGIHSFADSEGGTIENTGKISIQSTDGKGLAAGIDVEGKNINVYNKETGIIELKDLEDVIGINSIGENNTVNNAGEINISSLEAVGIFVANTNKTAVNEETGKIIIKADSAEGMRGENSKEIINKGLISITANTDTSIGMAGENTYIENAKDIIMEYISKNENDDAEIDGILISGENSKAVNRGNVTILSKTQMGYGMYAEAGAMAENYGIITVTAEGATDNNAGNGEIISGKTRGGMIAFQNSEVINKTGGIINVDGAETYGMIAEGPNSKATNEGTINVGANAAGAMWATDGGTITNNGTINIDSSHAGSQDEANKFAMQADEGSTIGNYGTINFDKEVAIKTDISSSYIIGTNKDGSYGKLSAENISLDGNVEVSAEIAKKDYKNSYVLDNAFSGKTELEKDYRLTSSSLLYTAQSTTDKEGNLDVELVRNGNNTADFTDKNFKQAAEVFDKAINNEEYRNSLSEEEKELVEKIFDRTGSAAKINDTVKEISGYEYGNLARQIFDTKDMFKSYDKSIIDSLGDYNFNFNFIGAYADVDSKHGVAGYDSKVTGIAGAMKFTDSLYGVIGYGYNDIDYDGSSDGKIQTIHTGLYKDMKSVYGDVRFGVFAEYNFHETDRKVLDERADSDFDSYLAGAEAEVSRKFGDDLYIKPALSLDVSYGKYEDFTENGSSVNLKVESQDYVSVVPALELKAGKVLGMSEVYTAVKYSYEFGDMNKSQDMELIEKFSVENDNIENAQTDIKVGTVLNLKNISVNAEIGKEFGKRDREYVKAGFSYTF